MNLPVVRYRLSEEMLSFSDNLKGETISLGRLVDFFASRGHSALVIILCLPFMTPIPIPGLSVIFGGIIAIAGIRMGLGASPYVPQFIKKREINSKTVKNVFEKASLFLSKLERILKPRLLVFYRMKAFRILDGVVLVAMGILLALPLPPGTNFPPALAILCIGLGTLEKDGLFLLAGYVLFSLNIVAVIAVAKLGFEGTKALLGI